MLLWAKIKQNLQHALIVPFLAYIFVKRNIHKKGVVAVHFFHNHNHQGGTGKFLQGFNIIDNKPLLSSMIDYEAAQVSHTTRIALLPDSCMFCSNFPAILRIIAIDSYIAI